MNKYNENQNISNTVYSLAEKEFSHSEIFDILKGNNEDIKPTVLLDLKELKNQEELDLLMYHLTNHDGRIREAAAFKLLELKPEFAIDPEILIAALLDVNPNVCRYIVEFLGYYKGDIKKNIIHKIKNILDEIAQKYSKTAPKFMGNREKSRKDHAFNKKIFNLYWCLEALCSVLGDKIDNDIEEILNVCTNFCDYTIREKTAQILAKVKNPPRELFNKLKDDDNFYVRSKFTKDNHP